jgi:hypothetical protein
MTETQLWTGAHAMKAQALRVFGLRSWPDEAHRFVIVNRSHSFYFSLGGEIFSFHLEVKRLSITWEAHK